MASTIQVNAVIEEARFNRFFLMVFLLLSFAFIVAGIGVGAYGVTLPPIAAALNLTDAQAGLLASAGLFGMMVGALVFGALSDMFGRKSALAAAIVVFSVFNGWIVLVGQWTVFALCRFAAGIGVGALTPICVSLLSEYSPKANRTFLITVMMIGPSFGQFLAALAGLGFLDSHGWRFLYLFSFSGLLLLPFVCFLLPESMRFYVDRGQVLQVRRFLAKAAPLVDLSGADAFEVGTANKRKPPARLLFTKAYIRNTAALNLAFFCNLYMFYGVSTWLPALMLLQGYAMKSGITFLSFFLLGTAFAAPFAGHYADRFGYKKMMGLIYTVLAALIALISSGIGGVAPYVLVFAVGGCAGAAHNMALAITPQFYPIALRGTIIGLASASSRVGSALAPAIVGTLLSQHVPPHLIFLSFTIPALLGLAAIAYTRPAQSDTQNV